MELPHGSHTSPVSAVNTHLGQNSLNKEGTLGISEHFFAFLGLLSFALCIVNPEYLNQALI